MVDVAMNNALVSPSENDVRNDVRAVLWAEGKVKYVKSGSNHQPSPTVHYLQTNNHIKALKVSLYVTK